jgi:hypothetical protein
VYLYIVSPVYVSAATMCKIRQNLSLGNLCLGFLLYIFCHMYLSLQPLLTHKIRLNPSLFLVTWLEKLDCFALLQDYISVY